MKVDNAVIMAAGVSSRFVPLSHDLPKGLITVKGEILIERQIKQLIKAGVPKIYIITGYQAEKFDNLKDKFDVQLIRNPDYLQRNNHSSIWAAKNILRNSYICSSDNYFVQNPFEPNVDESYYASVYADGHTDEWCMQEDSLGYIKTVSIGGSNSWYMLGHAFWTQDFTARFLKILQTEYENEDTACKLWETILKEHLDTLKIKIRKYPSNTIFEFDTLDELRAFDASYQSDTRSVLLKKAAAELRVNESELIHFSPIGSETLPTGFSFDCPLGRYDYHYKDGSLQKQSALVSKN